MHLRFIFADKALIAEDAALVEGGCDHLASQLLKIIELSGLDRQFDPPSDLHLRCPLTEIIHGYVISSEGGERIARREVVWAKGRFWKHPAGFSQGPQSAQPRRCRASWRRSAHLSESGCSASSAGTRLRAPNRSLATPPGIESGIPPS